MSESIENLINLILNDIRAIWQKYDWHFHYDVVCRRYLLTCSIGDYVSHSFIDKHLLLSYGGSVVNLFVSRAKFMIEDLNDKILTDLKTGNISYKHQAELLRLQKQLAKNNPFEKFEEEVEKNNPFEFLDLKEL